MHKLSNEMAVAGTLAIQPDRFVHLTGHQEREPGSGDQSRSLAGFKAVIQTASIRAQVGQILREVAGVPRSRRQDCRKASRSSLIVSACVVGMPCCKPW